MSGSLPTSAETEIIRTVMKQFASETPGVYRWAVSAVGFIIFSVVVATMVKPEIAGYVICAVVFMILLIFILLSIEKAADKAAWQVSVLSWFSVATLMVGASAIMGSLLFGWPLFISLAAAYDDPAFLDHIHHYDMEDSDFVRTTPKHWRQSFSADQTINYDFEQRGLSADYLLLYDNARKLTVRIPAHGGIAEWSDTFETSETCKHTACWVDISRATLSMR